MFISVQINFIVKDAQKSINHLSDCLRTKKQPPILLDNVYYSFISSKSLSNFHLLWILCKLEA